MTRLPAWAEYFVLPILNVCLALAVAGLVIYVIGENPIDALLVMIDGAFGRGDGLGYTLYYATSLIFVALAVSIAFQAKLFNIGGEGQALIGTLGAFLVYYAFDAWMPAWLIIPLAIMGAALFGAGWAAIPAVLQAYRGSHIVITTIMLNFIGSALMVWLLSGILKEPGRSPPKSRAIAEDAQLPQWRDIAEALGFEAARSPLNPSFLLALLACVGVWVLVWRTRWGYALRTTGASEQAGRYAGVNVRWMIVSAMLLSGALAGLMAVNVLVGGQDKLTTDIIGGVGFTGIAVALMGRNHPVGIVFSAVLFGALIQGGVELDFEFQTISREVVQLIQGLIVLFSGALALMLAPALSWILVRKA